MPLYGILCFVTGLFIQIKFVRFIYSVVYNFSLFSLLNSIYSMTVSEFTYPFYGDGYLGCVQFWPSVNSAIIESFCAWILGHAFVPYELTLYRLWVYSIVMLSVFHSSLSIYSSGHTIWGTDGSTSLSILGVTIFVILAMLVFI